ncbi:bifunctional adenosylcobinamide kinase/adenosylcobinamide-phosphate guanylyltransferase [Cocleimonas flava]|uniref:Bifunctional adenosylcobalamin biosynthesis protein n=1 Tax=Cocleimonas flava TaxID=634765 RepID=A0A4R1F9M1_9GAMM|nr:bifunctional adenosylcobinamide kinase/adenosylcobinamide-phosphate guanylyltransferase [Cocleimonas flava]TCJ88568.1 adenosylcobinamide kinase /adenosylcobinamide-phosphate guanylyltransferase [Cocleimonas flava]
MTQKIPSTPSSSLILGGARSGKSSFAENLAKESGLDVIYLATANAWDEETKQRVEKHKSDRPSSWKTIEEPIHLASCLLRHSRPEKIIIVDCLTMWLNNLLMLENPAQLRQELDDFLDCVSKLQGRVIFVSNEVGMGIIPLGELTRNFVDESGRLHQKLGHLVENVTLIVAGIPLVVKPQRHQTTTIINDNY